MARLPTSCLPLIEDRNQGLHLSVWQAPACIDSLPPMRILRRWFGPKRTENLVVYVLDAIIDGSAKAKPIGSAPRFPRAFEREICTKRRPTDGAIIDHAGHIFAWANDSIEAVAFLDRDRAEAFRGFTPFAEGDRVRLDTYLRHFPR